ncbi:fibulin-1-like [Adelges cooleyi]|uniref:fibulin-1-like n=1 Tax=Adelges cooleyi TaxID=133065 RepID=UPI0021804A6F|nr:fibulin-1-like [Adelges cooleyi]
MKPSLTVIALVSLFVGSHSSSPGSLENTLSTCCKKGKAWTAEHKYCNISLQLPLPGVPVEHNSICLSTVGACCMHSLRESRCLEGKQAALADGSCNEKTELGRSQVDFMMCCELCKIGMMAGSIETPPCKLTNLFAGTQWDELYGSCCQVVSSKLKPSPLIAQPKGTSSVKDLNPCIAGTHSCTSTERCVNTLNGFQCLPRLISLPLSLSPRNATVRNRLQSCDPGFAFDVLTQKCADVDECTQLPCESNELCENSIGSYKCHCKTGFQLDKITNACTDINECQLNVHGCGDSQRCDNTVGSYQCVRFTGCGTGYTLDVDSATCVDDDECTLKTDSCGLLGPDWICRNTLGSFRCERKRSCPGPTCRTAVVQATSVNTTAASLGQGKCLRGYERDEHNLCKDINECKSPNRCLYNEICINTNGSYYCLPKSKTHQYN